MRVADWVFGLAERLAASAAVVFAARMIHSELLAWVGYALLFALGFHGAYWFEKAMGYLRPRSPLNTAVAYAFGAAVAAALPIVVMDLVDAALAAL